MSTDELISNYKEVFTQKFAKFDGRAGRKGVLVLRSGKRRGQYCPQHH